MIDPNYADFLDNQAFAEEMHERDLKDDSKGNQEVPPKLTTEQLDAIGKLFIAKWEAENKAK